MPSLRVLLLALFFAAVACDIVPTEPSDDVNSDNLRDEPPALLLRGGSRALVACALVVAVAAMVLGALGFLPATRLRSREVVEQLE